MNLPAASNRVSEERTSVLEKPCPSLQQAAGNNQVKINTIIESLKQQGDVIGNDALSHIFLLPYKHVLPNGTYSIDEE
jgi:hypothetical protein